MRSGIHTQNRNPKRLFDSDYYNSDFDALNLFQPLGNIFVFLHVVNSIIDICFMLSLKQI